MISYEVIDNIVTVGFKEDEEVVYISIINDSNKTKEELIEQARRELRNIILEQEWEIGKMFEKDDIVNYKNKSYKVLQKHISRRTWTPDAAKHLFEVI